MVAAIFPVAIQQSRTSSEETTGATVARGGAGYLERVATNSVMPATNNVVVGPDFDAFPPPPGGRDFRDGFTLTGALHGSTVVAADQRYAWVPFYRRAGDPTRQETWSPFAQVFMVPVFARNVSDYGGLTKGKGALMLARGGPQVAQRVNGIFGTARIMASIIRRNPTDPNERFHMVFNSDRDVPSEGAYVIIADATRSSDPNWNERAAPHVQGRIYRLGNPVPTGNPEDLPVEWEFMPGFEFEPIRVDLNGKRNDGAAPTKADGKEALLGTGANALNDITVFVVGRGVDQSDPAGVVRSGTAQDVAAYTTFVTVK
jgi:hypothetical protein